MRELFVAQHGVWLHFDSESDIYMENNQVYLARIKHIDVRFSKIRELHESGLILLNKVHTSDNATDMLTKSVIIEKFKYCLDLLHSS